MIREEIRGMLKQLTGYEFDDEALDRIVYGAATAVAWSVLNAGTAAVEVEKVLATYGLDKLRSKCDANPGLTFTLSEHVTCRDRVVSYKYEAVTTI